MKNCRMYRGVLRTILSVAICSFALLPKSYSATEETFPTLQVGTRVYTNVTVTTKAKKYIFIHHSSGMQNIKVADLPDEIRTQLGYVPEVTKSQKASNWAKAKMSDLKIGDVNAAELKDPKKWQEQSAVVLEKARALDNKLCGAILGGVLLLYLFFSACCMLICRKSGSAPGFLVWLPLLKVLPLLRAARMSPVWFVFYLFVIVAPCLAPLMPPLFAIGCLLFCLFLNVLLLVGAAIWCFKIADARGKSPLVGFCLFLSLISPLILAGFRPLVPVVGILPLAGFCLLIPVISLFAFLYLALSDSIPEPSAPKEDDRTAHLMTLETA